MPIDPIDPDGVLALLGQNHADLYAQTDYPEMVPHLPLPPTQGAAGSVKPVAERSNEPAAHQTAEPARPEPTAADLHPEDVPHALAGDLPENLPQGLPPAAKPAFDMGEQPSSARVAIASLGSGASKPAALPRRETPPAAKPAARPQRAHRATSPAVIASPAPVTGFGKIGRARLAQIVDHVELMPGESVEDHAEFSEAIHHDLAPQTPVDLIHVADYLYLRWQLRRVRLWKHELQRGAATAAFVALMKAHLPNLDAAARAKRWRKGHPNSRTRKIMRDAGITSSSVVARALSDHLALFEALEMLDARLDARARDVLRDYERQREARGRRQSNRPLIEGLFRPADNENEEHGDDSAISS